MEHSDYLSIHPGTAVTRCILDRLQSPDDGLKIIHIAGTNGKGSTAEFFTRILISAGKKVGTFTSPAVYDFYDQFKVDSKPLSAETAEKYFDTAHKASEGLNATDFEIQTAGIIYAFFKEGCEYAVIECGMGGLNDATNAIHKKQLAVITSVSLEHTAYLGNTIEEICTQKAGIITKDCPAIINAHQGKEVKGFFKGCKFADKLDGIYDGGFIYDGKRFTLNANGILQPHNAATAIEGCRLIGIDEKTIYEGIKNAQPRGRLEKFEVGGRTYILDGAHNPAAFEPLKEYLKQYSEDLTLIYGSLYDKDIDGNLKILSCLTDRIIAVECKSLRKTALEKTESICRKYFKNVSTASSVSDALNNASTKTAAVCGSFTLLTEAKQWIENLTGKRQ